MGYPKDDIGNWKCIPSIFMPRSACRIVLEIIDVKVERLQEITNGDAVREGIKPLEEVGNHYKDYENKDGIYCTPKGSFSSLWASINGADSWLSNPFVWVITFKKIDPK